MTRAVALTCGEPAGIGPEIAVAAWRALGADLPFFLIGDPAHLPEGAPHVVMDPRRGRGGLRARVLPVLRHDFAGPRTPGTPDPAQAQGVIDVIARGVDLVQSGQAVGLCTAPIHKQALQEGAGFRLARPYRVSRASGGRGPGGDDAGLGPVARGAGDHPYPAGRGAAALTGDLLEAVIRITHAAMIRDFGVAAPRLAVAGLNPHAGEGGRMGREEIEVIAPVLDRLRAEGSICAGRCRPTRCFMPPQGTATMRPSRCITIRR